MAKVTKKPTVRFSQKAYQQMFALTHACKIEISAMGIVATAKQKEEAGVTEDFYVTEFFVIDQECTGTSTDLDDDAMVDLLMNLRDQGIQSEQMCVWWHSHVNMGTGHSGTDEAQIERFDFDTVCISIITNKKGELNLRVDMFQPFRHSFEKCDYTLDFIDILPDNWAEEMVDTHVNEKKVIPQRLDVVKSRPRGVVTGYGGNWGGWNRWEDTDDERNVLGVSTVNGREIVKSSELVDDEEEDLTNGVAFDALDLPKELGHLQSAWDLNLLDTQDVMELFAKWYAKELSTEEVVQELEEIHNIRVSDLDAGDDEDPADVVVDTEVDDLLTFDIGGQG